MPKYFRTIEAGKQYARERVKADEETYHIGWDADYRAHNGTKWDNYPVAVFSDPERKYGTVGKLDKQVFATIKTSNDPEGQLTMTLDIDQWKLVAQMLDIENKELGSLSNEEILLLDKLREAGVEW